jgi:hypothetical protein
MALLRLFLGWPTPTELIFDRIFPLLTVEFFIGSLVRAGGYTPLKLQGVFGALAGQVIVAGLGGVLYAFYLRRRVRRAGARSAGTALFDRRGWPLIIPGVLAATALFVALLWPTLVTNYFEAPFQVGKTVELRGMAFGGDRGISKVEISSDDGETWDDAEITKAGTKLSWSLWSYQWTPDEEGETGLVVRATDGNGQLQISEYRDQVPDGATGLHRVRAIVEKA